MRSKLALAALILLAAATARADEYLSRRVESESARGNIKRVVIDIPAGEIEVRNGTGDKIAVKGFIRYEYGNRKERDEAKKIIDNTTAEIYMNKDEAVVRRRFGKDADWKAFKFTQFDLVIEVPRDMEVDVDTRFGDVTVDGTFGNVDIDLRAGDVEVRMPKSSVKELNASCRVGEVRTDLGHQTIEREGLFPGRTTWRNNTGGKSKVNVHVTAGDVDVKLTQ